jgi:serine/threonine protein kinase
MVASLVLSFMAHRQSRGLEITVRIGKFAFGDSERLQATTAGSDLGKAVGANDVELLSAKRGRSVFRLPTSSFGPCIAKIADADRPEAVLGLHAEGAILTYLGARGFKHAPAIKGIEVLPPSSVVLFREDVPGETLHNRLRSSITNVAWPTNAMVLTVSEAVGRTVAGLHNLQVVHGDLKPANVIFQYDGPIGLAMKGAPTLIDFEGSQFCRSNGEDASARSGTWGFIAPERYFASNPLKQSDVFSLSALTWFLFVGRVGLYGSSARARIPEPIRSFLQSSLDIDPRARPGDAQQWLQGLETARSKLAEEVLNRRVLWPKNWIPENETLLSQTLGRSLAIRAQQSEQVSDAWETMNRNAMRAVRSRVKGGEIELFRDFLDSGLALSAFATERKMSHVLLREKLQSVYDSISRAIAGEANQAIAEED